MSATVDVARVVAGGDATTAVPTVPVVVVAPVTAPQRIEQVLAVDAALGATGWSADALADELGRDDRCWLAACVDDDVVGFAGLGMLATDAHVLAVGVLEPWRGRGVGMRLIEALIEAAQHTGAAGLTLEVRAGNSAARRLYRRAGFVEEGIRPGYYADAEDAVIAWRRWP